MQKNSDEQVKVLETERLRLRHLCSGDADFMVQLLNEPGFLQNIGDRVRNAVDASRYILTRPVANYQRLGFGMYLVELKEMGEPIGICGLLKRESTQEIEIGFACPERFWARGYAYEAAAGVMDHARTSLGLKRIAADGARESGVDPDTAEIGTEIRKDDSGERSGTRDESVCAGGVTSARIARIHLSRREGRTFCGIHESS